jgi:putative membrane protein
MTLKTLSLTALACAVSATLAAQAPTTADKTKTSPAQHKTADSKMAGDHHFVTDAAIGGMAEVELGRLATEKAENADVKQFGQRMVDDHGKANDELKQLAASKNITLPTELDAKHKATHDQLSKLSGAAFDRAYMRDMVQDHTKDVAAFTRESKSGTDAQVKEWAGQKLPTLNEHLKMAKDINGKLTAGTSGKKPAGTSGKKPGR